MSWLSGRGHFNPALSQTDPRVIEALSTLHEALGGEGAALAAKRSGNPPMPDLIHIELGCIIDVDEVQHFTTARMASFEHYPEGLPLGFDVEEYRRLITTPQASLHVTDWPVARPAEQDFVAPLRRRPLDRRREPCYRGPWRLPGPDPHRLADESLRSNHPIIPYLLHLRASRTPGRTVTHSHHHASRGPRWERDYDLVARNA